MEEDYHYLPCFDSEDDMQSIDGLKTFFHEFYIESKKLWILASPAISTSICQYSIAQITQLFAGHLGVLQLAAVSVENSVIAGLCYGALLGMGSALETLCGQAYGAKQLDMLGVYLQRSLIILNTAALALMFLYLFATQILLFIGQPMDIAKWAGKFSIWMIPQLFAYAMNFPIQKFLQAQSKMMVMAIIAAIALVGHTLLSWLFMMKMDLGLVAGAVVLNGSWWFMVLAQFVYILCGTCGEAWSGFTFKAFENLWGFVRLSLASGVMICLEYWYFMALIISAGYVKDAKIAVDAVSICTSIVGWTFMLCIGFNAAISVRVSNELGAGHPRTAKFSVLVVSITSLLIGTILTITLFVARSRYPPLFTKSFEVQQAVYELTPLLGTTIMLNGLQPTLSGVAIGAGWQIYVAYINIVSYYAFGIPLGLIFSFCLDMGAKIPSIQVNKAKLPSQRKMSRSYKRLSSGIKKFLQSNYAKSHRKNGTTINSQARVGGQTPDPIVAPDSQTPRTQPAAAVAPRLDSMEFPDMTSHLVNRPSMTIDEQKMFGRFRLMNPPTYTGDLAEDAYEFIVSCHERLHNLGLVESHGVDYTAFHFCQWVESWFVFYSYIKMLVFNIYWDW